MSNGKILFVIASKGFQQIEYNVPKKILENTGFTVVTASDLPNVAIAKDDTTTAHVDVTIDNVHIKDYSAIFFIGGPGTLTHLDNEHSYEILKKAQRLNMPIGAICIATRILAHAGILTGKQATGWNGDDQLADIYQQHRVQYRTNQAVVIDENIITATGPDAAQEFAEQIIILMQSNKGWG